MEREQRVDFFPRGARATCGFSLRPLSEPVVSDSRGVASGDKGNRIVSFAKGIDGSLFIRLAAEATDCIL